MSYQLANRQPHGRERDATGPMKPPFPHAGIEPDDAHSNVIPLPAVAPREIEPEAWEPPKEVIWMGHRQRVLALSEILLRRLSEPKSESDHTGA